MSIIQIIVHPQMLAAALIYAGLSFIGIALFDRVHSALEYSVLPSATLGERLDRRFNVVHTGELISRSIILFLQYPVITIFCQGLGRQLT